MINNEDLKFMYTKMMEIRLFDQAATATYKQRLWKGSLHLSIAQEAAPAAAAAVTQSHDYFISNHRGHGHVLAKGVDPKIFMAELFGRVDGMCGGRGGSLHSMDSQKRVFPHGLVGSGAYIAAGIGYAITYQKQDSIVVCFVGDGSVNAGGFHEGVNMAAVWNAPVVYICENNGIGVSTRIEETTPIPNISQRAIGYGIKGITVDGSDPLIMYKTIKNAVDETRSTKRPILIEAVTQRYLGHTGWDDGKYRTDEENRRWMYYDPIKRLKEYILGENLFTVEEVTMWEDSVRAKIEGAVEFAKNSATPPYTKEEALKNIYA